MGIFPYCLKYAVVKSLYKMEDQSRVPAISKVLDRATCHRVHHYSQVYKKKEGNNGVRIPGNRTSRKKPE